MSDDHTSEEYVLALEAQLAVMRRMLAATDRLTFGRDMPEMYLPVDPAERSRSADIWAQTSETLGAPAPGGMIDYVPNKPKTPLRNVRIDDELWDSAKAAAANNGETVSDVIRRSLQTYIERDGHAS